MAIGVRVMGRREGVRRVYQGCSGTRGTQLRRAHKRAKTVLLPWTTIDAGIKKDEIKTVE
jgi:hypothetical protein